MSRSAPKVAVILAGGLARRMGGGDKPLVRLAGKTMLERVIARLAPQVDQLLINANGDPERFSAFGRPVIADTIPDFAGPLAGILAGLRWVEAHAPEARGIVSVAADTPFFPDDLVDRLSHVEGDHTVALATSGGGVHPVFGWWPIALADDLQDFLGSGQGGKILAFVDRHARADVAFDPVQLIGLEAFDPFYNVNTPEEAARAEEIAAALDRRVAA